MPDHPLRTGAHLLIEALCGHGAGPAFHFPGAIEAPDIRFVPCASAAAASVMAEACGRLTGRPGLALVADTVAADAAQGVRIAARDATPLVLLVAEDAPLDLAALLGPEAGPIARVAGVDSIPAAVADAFHAAAARPGSAVLALPRRLLAAESRAAPVAPRPVAAEPPPDGAMVARVRDALAAAQRPLVVAGGPGWSDADAGTLLRAAEAGLLPVCCTARRRDFLDNESVCYAGALDAGGDPALLRRVGDCDLLLLAGADLADLPEGPPAGVPVIAGPPALTAALADAVATGPETGVPPWADWAADARADCVIHAEPEPFSGTAGPGAVFGWLKERLPVDAVVACDGGPLSGPALRPLLFRRPGRLLVPAAGAYGLPAAVAAKLLHPGRIVLGICDGAGFAAFAPDLATAAAAGAAPLVLVVNAGPDDAAERARGHGAFAVTVEHPSGFVAAFWEALWSRRPAVIDLRIDSAAGAAVPPEPPSRGPQPPQPGC
ncbi:thiamine pyrophosphate-binding protein [Azospirillum halopraeferens]|uniref:thiamine pyrophosphate-binding protein n=1 Tax=Azospirillum halopraeferens TaxID=34010 RepID=UPI00041B6342|nr:thiamine pyrophosphate-binding protein [Azospirillum halopraeferens]